MKKRQSYIKKEIVTTKEKLSNIKTITTVDKLKKDRERISRFRPIDNTFFEKQKYCIDKIQHTVYN